MSRTKEKWMEYEEKNNLIEKIRQTEMDLEYIEWEITKLQKEKRDFLRQQKVMTTNLETRYPLPEFHSR